VRDRESLKLGGSDSSRTVGDIACVTVLRLEVSEEDMRLSIRLARLDFFSAFSSLLDDEEPAVCGGEVDERSRLEIDKRLLIDIGLWVAWVDGGRDGDLMDGDRAAEGSMFIDRRLSENEVRPSLIRSLITVIDDLRSRVTVLELSDESLSFERRLSCIVSFGASATAF
jgi:hypothetical protein